MSNIHDAIANEEIEHEVTTAVEQEAAVSEPTEKVEPKAMSLDDALAKAFEKHVPADGEEKPKTALPGTPAVAATPGKTVDPITGRESEPMKAPAGWTPLLRQKWDSVEPVVQKFIHDREREMAQNFTKTAEDRKLAAEVKEAFSPYESTIRQFNISGVQLAKELMTQWHGLQTGDGVQKAQIIAGLLNHFRPDPQALQQILAGQAPAQGQAQRAPDVSELVKAELAKRDEEHAMKSANHEIATFQADPKNEYFNDVHDTMKRILEAQLVDAPDLPTLLKKAYDLACTQHPEISQIIAARTPVVAATAVQRPNVKPVGSVKASPGTGKPSKSAPRNMSLDDAINEAVSRHVK